MALHNPFDKAMKDGMPISELAHLNFDFERDPIEAALTDLKAKLEKCHDFESGTMACEATRSVWLSYSDEMALNFERHVKRTQDVISALTQTAAVVEMVAAKGSTTEQGILRAFIRNINERVKFVQLLSTKGHKGLMDVLYNVGRPKSH